MAVGRLEVVSDNNFARSDIGGGNFQGVLYAMRMTHNGEPLVYRSVQIPLAFNDLVPGRALSGRIITQCHENSTLVFRQRNIGLEPMIANLF